MLAAPISTFQTINFTVWKLRILKPLSKISIVFPTSENSGKIQGKTSTIDKNNHETFFFYILSFRSCYRIHFMLNWNNVSIFLQTLIYFNLTWLSLRNLSNLIPDFFCSFSWLLITATDDNTTKHN